MGKADPRQEVSSPSGGSRPPRLSGRSGYSLFVGTLKVVLPALAVGMMLLVLVWPRLAPDEGGLRIGLSDLNPDGSGDLDMVNPRFQGRDTENRPFSIVAAKATQRAGGTDRIDLEAPKADITLEQGAWMALSANTGVYDRAGERLDLAGNVSLFHDRGFEMHTQTARIDLNAGVARSDAPVAGQGPAGHLEAQGFRLSQDGARIHFLGRSRLTVYPETLEDGGS